VNNVGSIGKATFFLDLEPERWEQAFWLNLFPTFNATHAVLPKMVERRDGAIVSIASDATFGEPRMSDYGPMKAGVLAFSRIIAKEFGRFGIRANSICPGLVLPEPDAIGEHILRAGDVGFGEREVDNITSSIPLRRRPEATDLAAAVAMLAPERARMLTGQLLSVSGGFAMPR
jgi:NAD(P)-dependent dehydrogenase (short-subunit alcohol dehydrogenase family)